MVCNGCGVIYVLPYTSAPFLSLKGGIWASPEVLSTLSVNEPDQEHTLCARLIQKCFRAFSVRLSASRPDHEDLHLVRMKPKTKRRPQHTPTAHLMGGMSMNGSSSSSSSSHSSHSSHSGSGKSENHAMSSSSSMWCPPSTTSSSRQGGGEGGEEGAAAARKKGTGVSSWMTESAVEVGRGGGGAGDHMKSEGSEALSLW